MTDSRTALKAFLVYAISIPLALTLGYLLANPLDRQGLTLIGGVFIILCAPLMIHYHYPFMLLVWNMGAVAFFLPAGPNFWMLAVALSFGVSFTHRILDKQIRAISVKELTGPLLVLGAVALITAGARGGIGLRSMGGDTAGGKRYVEIFLAILGYFALTARQIPRERVNLYIGLFFLSGALGAISILYGRVPAQLNFIFLFIPPSEGAIREALGMSGNVMGFFRPFATAGSMIFAFLLARYGLRQMLAPGRKHLLVLLALSAFMAILSGSRLALVVLMMSFFLQFWLEGLFRTRAGLVLLLVSILAAAVVIPFATKLPYPIQRTLALLPIEVDPVVRMDASGSLEWRREIWRATIPHIPEYLLLGKGYAISRSDLGFIDAAFAEHTVEERAATISGEYHNGPLSVIIPLGIWGVLAVLWLLGAGLRMLWRNYKYGPPDLRVINTYLLASFLMMTITFMFVFGSLYSGLVGFTGILGFSVALNGGAPSRAVAPVPLRPVERKPRAALAPRPNPNA